MASAVVVIPHFFEAGHDGERHDSRRPASRAARARALARTILRLHELFGARRWVARHQRQGLTAEPNAEGLDLEVVVVTVSRHHLVDELGAARARISHRVVDTPPVHLGFAAHRVLAEQAGRHQWYAYLEDDILIEDPYFLLKLAYFNREFPQGRTERLPLLLPQRYETPLDVDGEPADCDAFYPDYQLSDRPLCAGPVLALPMLGRTFHLEPCYHPHAGCFFLDEPQLQALSRAPEFANPREIWVTPLDTAATLAIWRTFSIYKPALDSLRFFEVRHQRPIMLGHVRPRADGLLSWR